MSRRSSTLVAVAMLAVFVVGVAFSTLLTVANGNFDLAEHGSLWLAFSAFMAMGALIVAFQPGNAVGWIFSAIGLLAATGSLAQEYALYAYVTRPGGLPLAILAAWYAMWWWFPTIILTLLYTLLLFPTGRLPSPRWRPLFWTATFATTAITVLAAVGPTLGSRADGFTVPNPAGISGVGNVEESAVGNILFAVVLACMAGAVLSLVLRFRRARGEERQQLKWFASAGALVVLMPLSEQLAKIGLPNFLFGAIIALLPTAAGVAVLRYRLYEIERIISRTVAYAVITAVLGGLYVVGVLLLGQLLVPLGPNQQLAVAGSTLAVAAAFGPVRRRVQALVDRRFNRSRYDAARTVEDFTARLRDEVDLGELSAALLAAVDRTLSPARCSLWLRPRATR